MVEDKKYCVYMHKNKTNGKVYIGITCQKPHNRWKEGRGYKNTIFAKAIKKYGWDGFEHIILYDKISKEDATQKEIELIKKYNSKDINFGYNMTDGGEATFGFKHSEESIKKMSESTRLTNQKNSKRVICGGIIFESMAQCAEYYGVPHHRISSWVNGRSRCPKKFVDMGLKFVDSDLTKIKTKPAKSHKTVICDGVKFDTITSCSRRYNVSASTMRKWLTAETAMPEYFKKLGLQLEDKIPEKPSSDNNIICNGIVFKNAKECAKYYGLKHSQVTNWTSGASTMPKEFYDLGMRKLNSDIEIKVRQPRVYGTPKQSIKVYCHELDMEFESIRHCLDYFKYNIGISISRKGLIPVLNGDKNNHKGYCFKKV